MATKKRVFWVTSEWFAMIDRGRRLEARLGYYTVRLVRQGEVVTLRCDDNTRDVKIVAVRQYSNITAMLDTEDPAKLAPGMSREQIEDGLRAMQCTDGSIHTHGCLIIWEFEPATEGGI